MRRRRQAAAQPQPALAQAHRWEDSTGAEAGRQRGQVLLGHRVVEAQAPPSDVEEDPEGFDLGRDGVERLQAAIVRHPETRALPLEPPAAAAIR